MQVNWKKLILPNIPYFFIALFATKLGQAIRLAPGADLSGKIMHFMEGMVLAFESSMPSFHPADLCVGIAVALGIRLPESCRSHVRRTGKGKSPMVLKSLMDREDVTSVINACDAGREGELIFRTVYYLAGCSKPMKRLWISSLEDDAIRDGFDHLRPGYEFDGLHKSALCRAKADWLVGINATRFFSLTYGFKLNIGRVMSPTLALLVQRESEIGAFIPENYYTVNLEYGSFTASSEKFPDKQKADALASACKNDDAIIQKANTKEKAEKAPVLYDLTTLQRDANRLLGYTAQQTLDYLQALYEKKLCTYPRTDSRFLTDDMANSVMSIVLCAAGISGLDVPGTVLSHQVCNSKKVSDHHAIIPTIVAGEYDLTALPKGEQEILKLISRQVLIAVSGVYRYQETNIAILCGGAEFTATLKMPLDI